MKVLKVSFTGLMENDLAAVNRMLNKLPNCVEVDLRGNKFYESTADEHLLRMLRTEQVRLVNIVLTPFASVDRRNFFEKLTENDLQRLIWIPEAWLERKKWKNMLYRADDKDKKFAISLETHRAYYLKQAAGEEEAPEKVKEK